VLCALYNEEPKKGLSLLQRNSQQGIRILCGAHHTEKTTKVNLSQAVFARLMNGFHRFLKSTQVIES